MGALTLHPVRVLMMSEKSERRKNGRRKTEVASLASITRHVSRFTFYVFITIPTRVSRETVAKADRCIEIGDAKINRLVHDAPRLFLVLIHQEATPAAKGQDRRLNAGAARGRALGSLGLAAASVVSASAAGSTAVEATVAVDFLINSRRVMLAFFISVSLGASKLAASAAVADCYNLPRRFTQVLSGAR